jgi:hypothetical protein
MPLLIMLAVLAAGPPAAPEKAADAKPKMVCRTETPTGSRFSRRVCMTAEEATAQSDASKKAFETLRNRPSTPTR